MCANLRKKKQVQIAPKTHHGQGKGFLKLWSPATYKLQAKHLLPFAVLGAGEILEYARAAPSPGGTAGV